MIQSHQKCQDSNKLLLADIGSRLSSLHKQLNINPPHRDDSEIRASALRTEIQLLSEQVILHDILSEFRVHSFPSFCVHSLSNMKGN